MKYGLPVLGVCAALFQIRSHIQAHKAKKLETLDEDFVNELAGEDDTEKKRQEEAAAKQRKAKAKLEQRLAQEKKALKRKAGTKKKKGNDAADEDGDEVDALMAFANSKKKQ